MIRGQSAVTHGRTNCQRPLFEVRAPFLSPHQTWFFDTQTSYDIVFTPPVEAVPVPGYSKGGKEVAGKEKEAPPVPYSMPCWKTVLNNTRITVGVNNIFGQRPPTSFGFELSNSLKYPGFSYDNLGRFVYARLIKKF